MSYRSARAVVLVLALTACASGSTTTHHADASAHADGTTVIPMPGDDDAAMSTDPGTHPQTDSGSAPDPYALRHDGMADLPPTYCLADGGRVTGDAAVDPYCPADRNLEGCVCPAAGMTAPCWTGPRAARSRGSCHDGTTTCIDGDIPLWGPCVGEVDPDPTATRGPATCNCFSMGTWALANTSPCFEFTDMAETHVAGATSTVMNGTMVSCGTQSGTTLMPPAPTWSTDTLQVDCGGTFHVCYKLRAFASIAAAMAHTAAATDCVMASPCVDVVIAPGATSGPVTLPPLPGWATTTPAQTACAQQFVTNGGYAEMVVSGTSYECQDFAQGSPDGYVFNRVQYCPSACTNPNVPAAMRPAICAMCTNGGSGNF